MVPAVIGRRIANHELQDLSRQLFRRSVVLHGNRERPRIFRYRPHEWAYVLLRGVRGQRRRGWSPVERGVRDADRTGHETGRTQEPPSHSWGWAGDPELATAFQRRRVSNPPVHDLSW